MRKSGVINIIVIMTLAGCATTPPVTMSTAFDPNADAWAMASGNNGISGSAVLRTRGGDVKTCAGLEVRLVPMTAYSTEWVQKNFGSSETGISQSTTVAPDPAIGNHSRSTVCDAQGHFSFSDLPDGDYYVIGRVSWEAPSGFGRYTYMAGQGGDLMQHVHLEGGQTKDLVLTA